MSQRKAFLEKVRIKNFLSLRNVTLPLKPLTVLVGPNASGKSNALNALYLLNGMMIAENPPPVELIQDWFWAGEALYVAFELEAEVQGARIVYELTLKPEDDRLFVDEELSVSDVKVITVEKGEGTVQDEDGKNETRYKSNNLALKSAGDYGNKPITRALTNFIKVWKFYDFQPDIMRREFSRFIVENAVLGKSKELRESPQLDFSGSTLSALLSDWHEKTPERFQNVSKSLADSTNFKIDRCQINGDSHLCLLEGYKKPIPLERASDGTLRLVAYYILLNEPELPPFIAIEEPERNLHPGALTDIAYVLEKLAERTQVIITTHSSQLLDNFTPESLSNSLGVLLLRNRPGFGTEVLNIEDIHDKQVALEDWIADFGIGSAIFDSELLRDLMEEPIC